MQGPAYVPAPPHKGQRPRLTHLTARPSTAITARTVTTRPRDARPLPTRWPGITAADVPTLTLKWAFGFPGGAQAYGHPTIAAGRVFVGGDTSRVYSLDAATGCTYWSFVTEAGVRGALSIGALKSAGGSRYAAYFGDLKANVYA